MEIMTVRNTVSGENGEPRNFYFIPLTLALSQPGEETFNGSSAILLLQALFSEFFLAPTDC